jgi:membrane fusion protein (multidrug efflux system)
VRWALYALLPLALIAGAYWYVTGGQVVSVDDAYVEAETVGVATDVSGIVKEIDVVENQHVDAGQVLYRLDPRQFQIAFDSAKANLAQTGLTIESMKEAYKQLLSDAAAQKGQVDLDQANYDRYATLVRTDAISQANYDQARFALEIDKSKLESLRQQAAVQLAKLAGDPNIPAYLAASTTAFYLVDNDHVWVDATPKETDLTYVRPGQPVTVTVDTYADALWRGVVASISPAAAQQFALLPAQNTSGNWVKVVQRVAMRIRIDTSNKNLPPLRAGMSVEVNVDTSHTRGLPRFVTALFGHARR